MNKGDNQADVANTAPYTDAARARMVVAMQAAELSDYARGLVPIVKFELRGDGSVEFIGDRIQAALTLLRQAQQVLISAVVFERMGGASWQQIGDALGTTRQSAHKRYAPAEQRFRDELAHPENPQYTGEIGEVRYRLHPGARDPEGEAAELDDWVVRHRETYEGDDARNPVSGGLVRMDPDAELRALSDRRHALFAEHALPPADELLAMLERELVVWEVLAGGSAARRRLAGQMVARTRRLIAQLRAGGGHTGTEATGEATGDVAAARTRKDRT